MATSDPQFSGFAPSFEACPAQSIRRSSLKASLEYDVGPSRNTALKDYEVPIRGCSSERKRSDNNKQRSSSKKKRKKSKSSSSSGNNNTSNNSERRSSKTNKLSSAVAKMMDGPMGKSVVTHLTDGTEKANSYTSRKKRAPAERATRPGVQHMTGDDDAEHQQSKDPATYRKNSRATRSANKLQDKILDFNSGGSGNTGPSTVSVVQDSKSMEEQNEYKTSSCLLGVDLLGGSGNHDEEFYVPPVANVQEEGYKSEKAKLFEGYYHNTNTPDPAQQENFTEQYTVVSRGSEDEELVEDEHKRFNDSFNLSRDVVLQKEDEERVQNMAATAKRGGAGAMPMNNPNQSQVVTARGMAGAPNYVSGTAAGGFAGFDYGDAFDDEGLAIAIAVDDSYYDGQDYYHHAIEFNPDAKPPLHKNRRFRFYSIITAIFVCLASGSAAAVLLLMSSDSSEDTPPSAAPSDAPTTATEGRYREQFISLVGPGVNRDGSAFDRAATWIMYEDQLRLSPIDDNLIQRYLLAYFYFETTQNEATAWKSCNRPKFKQEASCNHQKFMRNPVDDSIFFEPEPATRWLSETHECEWVGVQCDEGQLVIAIDVWGQELSGSLPAELALIPFLNSIALAYNDLIGTIPTEYAQMRHLVNLEIHGNRLSGSVPTEFWDTLTLQNFNIAENDITGTLSTGVGQLTGLKGLHFSDNLISGSMPSELGNLVYLSYMCADGNQLTGSIPTVLGNLKLLQKLWLQENLLSGTIPTQFGKMDELIELRMDRNRIYGTIPEELFSNKAELTKLDLQDLLLSGTLSTSIGNLKNLESLRLRRNRLTGTIPTELAKIRTLRLAWLHLNEFSGSMPIQVCSRVGPGFLQYLNADCGPEGAPAQECACCSGCCDRQTELCQLTDFNP